jgi:hypothetical protein
MLIYSTQNEIYKKKDEIVLVCLYILSGFFPNPVEKELSDSGIYLGGSRMVFCYIPQIKIAQMWIDSSCGWKIVDPRQLRQGRTWEGAGSPLI